jgi:hypothetical protein
MNSIECLSGRQLGVLRAMMARSQAGQVVAAAAVMARAQDAEVRFDGMCFLVRGAAHGVFSCLAALGGMAGEVRGIGAGRAADIVVALWFAMREAEGAEREAAKVAIQAIVGGSESAFRREVMEAIDEVIRQNVEKDIV